MCISTSLWGLHLQPWEPNIHIDWMHTFRDLIQLVLWPLFFKVEKMKGVLELEETESSGLSEQS